MKSLLPYNNLIGGLSGELKIGVEDHFDDNLQSHNSANISGGVGITKKISTDINIYLLAHIGAGHGNSKFYFYGYPEIGGTIYEIFNMKSIFSYKYVYNQLKTEKGYHFCNISQSFFLKKTYKLTIGYEYLFNKVMSTINIEVMASIYF